MCLAFSSANCCPVCCLNFSISSLVALASAAACMALCWAIWRNAYGGAKIQTSSLCDLNSTQIQCKIACKINGQRDALCIQIQELEYRWAHCCCCCIGFMDLLSSMLMPLKLCLLASFSLPLPLLCFLHPGPTLIPMCLKTPTKVCQTMHSLPVCVSHYHDMLRHGHGA